jgi:Kef-type K+ transport system membrane component KefB
VPTLKERGLTATRLGQTILAAAVAADFATMLLLSVFASIARQGLSAQVLLVLLLFVAFFVVSRIGLRLRDRRGVRRLLDELGHATAQIQVRGAFLLVLAFIALAQGLGAEVILGAFLAGASIALLAGRGGEELRRKLDAIGYGFLIPIFFITAGVGFDLPALLASGRSLVLVPGLVLAAFVVKLVPALVFRSQHDWRLTLAAGTLMSARLSLIVAAAAVGVRLGLISDALNAAIILVALVTSIVAPILFSLLMPDPAGARRPVSGPDVVDRPLQTPVVSG